MSTTLAVEPVVGQWWQEKIDALAVSRSWTPGQVIFHEGDQPLGVSIVRRGEIDLVFAGRHGVTKPLRKAFRGQILALSEAMSGRRHDATAVAHSHCATGFVPIEALRTLLDETPAAWFGVLRSLSQDVNQSWDSLRSISSR